ncbi:single-stranded DNA-binding protein [Nocardia asteroides]|uniref:single-stranded DNA-binding protein n=1 Tax=Nocardia asteroides TaxID=1824 RepID=UPI001E4F5990|nr:single-stranded DNA-binding protein [Nocardia asteroides]UGT60408.1 single-stranded DNA-binding protein [Nocardia asteroides]
MYEAMATVAGTVVTHPAKRELANGEPVITFRVASNSRRFDQASGEWVDNGTLFLTVSCWRRLVSGVHASIRRGDPVLVHGQLRTHEYRAKDGVERRDLEMRAVAIGPDLARCTAAITRRAERQKPEAGESEVATAPMPEARVAPRELPEAADGPFPDRAVESGTVSRPGPTRIAEPVDA